MSVRVGFWVGPKSLGKRPQGREGGEKGKKDVFVCGCVQVWVWELLKEKIK